MRLLVCGGRDYTDEKRVCSVLDRWHAKRPIALIITGACEGADWLAELWAWDNEIDYWGCPAKWSLHGSPKAGPIRNARMLKMAQPEWVLAFPGGPGTRGMVALARAAGVNVHEVKP